MRPAGVSRLNENQVVENCGNDTVSKHIYVSEVVLAARSDLVGK